MLVIWVILQATILWQLFPLAFDSDLRLCSLACGLAVFCIGLARLLGLSAAISRNWVKYPFAGLVGFCSALAWRETLTYTGPEMNWTNSSFLVYSVFWPCVAIRVELQDWPKPTRSVFGWLGLLQVLLSALFYEAGLVAGVGALAGLCALAFGESAPFRWLSAAAFTGAGMYVLEQYLIPGCMLERWITSMACLSICLSPCLLLRSLSARTILDGRPESLDETFVPFAPTIPAGAEVRYYCEPITEG